MSIHIDSATTDPIVDVLKTLIGAFVGTGLAFVFALRRDAIQMKNDRKAAGNFALLTLVQQTDDYLRAKAAILSCRNRALTVQPHTPLWRQIKPMLVDSNYLSALRFKFDSLAFLVDTEGGRQAIEHLLNCERNYHDFFHLLREHAETTLEIQRRFADAPIDPHQGAPSNDLERVASFALIARANSLSEAIFNHFERTDSTFRNACDELPRVLRSLFGAKGVIRIQLPTERDLLQQAEVDQSKSA